MRDRVIKLIGLAILNGGVKPLLKLNFEVKKKKKSIMAFLVDIRIISSL